MLLPLGSVFLEMTCICLAPEWALRLRLKGRGRGPVLGSWEAVVTHPLPCPCRYHPGL